ncbi:GNAT family N-acetyltransferase [Pseudoalteromonas porphyrae]|uniref:N-acetyltransferase domain-containing protein n=1 Tax=Pseudoalteromonas porphyrae TaxID=187330 RepID=A0A0N1MW00_9GAMM|nr:GNAT family N-acetyltransferase [Pseudoalteromonas porphyrae]KPH65145.1 hypothetical protein ADS77_02415 [Pseudoalteromonas porphyrae]
MIINSLTSESKVEFIDFINEVDADFTPQLTSRVNITDYADKLFSNAILLKAHKDNTIAAIVACYANDTVNKRAYIPFLAVRKQYRGLGLANEILLKIIVILRERKFEVLSLTVKKNSAAFRLYEKLGFLLTAEFLYEGTLIEGCEMELKL